MEIIVVSRRFVINEKELVSSEYSSDVTVAYPPVLCNEYCSRS